MVWYFVHATNNTFIRNKAQVILTNSLFICSGKAKTKCQL
jgi:hypothetical protein